MKTKSIIMAIIIAIIMAWPVWACASEARVTSITDGNIIRICDDQKQTSMFRGNTRTLNFHRHTCKYYNCKHCTMSFPSSIDAILAGYHPCAICNPDKDHHHQEHGATNNPFSPARHRELTDA